MSTRSHIHSLSYAQQLLELCDVKGNDGGSADVGVALQAIYALHGIFVAKKAHEKPPKAAQGTASEGGSRDANVKYREWLHDQYLDFLLVLIDVLKTGKPAVLTVPCLKVCQGDYLSTLSLYLQFTYTVRLSMYKYFSALQSSAKTSRSANVGTNINFDSDNFVLCGYGLKC